MENVVETVSKFVQETIAYITGDTDKAVALKNERLAKSAIKGQISALEGALVEAEVNVENAQENLKKATYPSELISSAQGYYNRILGCQEALDDCMSDLEDLQDSLKYAQDLLKDKF